MGSCCMAAYAGAAILYPVILWSPRNPIEDQATMDFISGILIFKWGDLTMGERVPG